MQEMPGAELLVSPIPYVAMKELKKEEDLFLILASDGLFDTIMDSEAVKLVNDIIRRTSGGAGWRPTDLGVKEAADSLVQTSLNRGTQDNVTAMVIAFQWDS